MGKIRVDGLGVVNIAGDEPTEAEKQAIEEAMAQMHQASTPQATPANRPTSRPSRLRDVAGAAANAAQGFFMGGADELAGVGSALLDPTNPLPAGRLRETAERNTGVFREAERDFARRRPLTAFGVQLAGALAGPGKVAGLGAGARALPVAARIGAGAGVGAGTGAVAGGLSADGGPAERARGAVTGALIGGPLGGAFVAATPILRFASNAVRKVTGRLPPNETERRAAKVIMKNLEDSGLTPEQAHAFFQQLDDAGVSGARLADLDENFVGLAQMVARQPGKGQNAARKLYEERIGAQGARTVKQISRTISDVDAREAFEAVTLRQKAAAQPLYERAYAQPLKADPGLDELFRRPTMRAALKGAQRRALDDGIDADDLGTALVGNRLIITPGASTRVIDYVKRDLDDKISAALRRGERDKARTFADMRAQMLAIVDEQNPDFAAARQTFAGEADNLAALQVGKDALRGQKSAADVAAEIQGYTDGQREMFKAGLVRGIRDMMDQTRDNANVIRRFFSTPAKRDIIRLAFDNDEDFARFADAMEFEAKLVENASRINPAAGSQTQRLQARAADAVEDFVEPTQGGVTGMALRLAQGAARAGRDVSNRQVQSSLANTLFQPGSQAIDDVTARMAQARLEEAMRQRALLGGLGGAAALGTQAGLTVPR